MELTASGLRLTSHMTKHFALRATHSLSLPAAQLFGVMPLHTLMSIFGRPKKTPPIAKEFETKWRIGAMTAVLIVRLTSRFRSEISLSAGEDTVNAKSMVDVVMLQSAADSENTSYATLRDAGLKAGSRIRVTAGGPDAAAAMDALSELFSFGARVDLCIEAGCPSPPILNGYTPDIIYYACSCGHAWTVSRSDASKVQPDA